MAVCIGEGHNSQVKPTQTAASVKTGFGERNIRSRKCTLADNYLYCDDCKKYNNGLCPQGCQTYEENREADHAKHTVPVGVKIATSSIPGAGMGAFALKAFPKYTFFGPYTGERHRSHGRANESGYAWTIEDAKGNVYNYVDASDPRRSNWLRYVNCPNKQENENLTAVQFNGELYYRSLRDIEPGEELFVYYGEEYARALGINPFEYPPIEENQEVITPIISPPPMPIVPSRSTMNTKKPHPTALSKHDPSKKRKRSKETLTRNRSRVY